MYDLDGDGCISKEVWMASPKGPKAEWKSDPGVAGCADYDGGGQRHLRPASLHHREDAAGDGSGSGDFLKSSLELGKMLPQVQYKF